jgi:hypothetical protein
MLKHRYHEKLQKMMSGGTYQDVEFEEYINDDILQIKEKFYVQERYAYDKFCKNFKQEDPNLHNL